MVKIILCLLLPSTILCQVLSIGSGGSVSIGAGKSVNVDGLELTPNVGYNITGSNTIYRSSTAVTEGNNSSLDRVYNASSLLSDFIGVLTFSYLDGELNNITESDLVLEIQAEDDSWTSFEGTVDEVNNNVSFTFTEPVSFKAVTASAAGATLTIEDISLTGSTIFIYPNPTIDMVYIQANNILKAELFDIRGRLLKTTNQNQIDLREITSGSFILKVTTINNSTKSFKIIKQ